MSDMEHEQDPEHEPEAGQRSSRSGCLTALAGIAIPMVLFSIPSIFPGTGNLQFGWVGVGFAMTITPLLVIMGIVVSVGGSRKASKSEDVRRSDSDRSPEFNW